MPRHGINGQRREFEVGRDLLPTTTLSEFLRERLGYTGLKISCDEGLAARARS